MNVEKRAALMRALSGRVPERFQAWIWPGILGTAAAATILAVLITNRPVKVNPNPAPPSTPAVVPVPAPNAGPPAAPAAAEYDSLIHDADQFIQTDSYPSAAQLLNQAIKRDPAKPQAYDMLAQIELYVFGQLPAAIHNYQAAIARGGAATFHVIHDHGSGNFAVGCKGLLSVSKANVRFVGSDSAHVFNATRDQVREFKKNQTFLNTEPQGIDPHAFHMKLEDGEIFNFAPTSRFTEAERDLILNTAGME